MCNGGWAYDAYPERETLDAGRTITIAQIEGPAVITCIHVIRRTPNMLSIYRFLGANAVRFNRSLDLRIDWIHEFRTWKKEAYTEFLEKINSANEAGGAYVHYRAMYYWYQDTPSFNHDPLPPLEKCLLP